MLKDNASQPDTSSGQGTHWTVQEFAHAKLGDPRRVKRLQSIVNDFAEHPTASIPQACGGWAATKAAYRFFDNDAVAGQVILDSHVEASVARMRNHSTVLCVQDTTKLNYSTHPQTKGLGPISNNRDKTLGLLVHSTLAVTPSGDALGLLQIQISARDSRQYARKVHQRNSLPIGQKESKKWLESYSHCQSLSRQCPNTTFVNIGDREGDLYDFLLQATTAKEAPRVEVLVRARHNRKVADTHQYLWDHLSSQRVAGRVKIKVPRTGNRPTRQVTLTIRFTQVTLDPPGLKEEQPKLTLWAVEAREVRPSKKGKSIHWRLLSTMPVTTLEEALEKIAWYTKRWSIETLHKVIKSGCKVEQRQLETVERLKRLLVVDMIVAWRVMALGKAARETPDQVASDWLSTEECQALVAYHDKKVFPSGKPPSIREVVRAIAMLGGFLARKGDGEPGPTVLWRGLHDLSIITAAWRRFSMKTCG